METEVVAAQSPPAYPPPSPPTKSTPVTIVSAPTAMQIAAPLPTETAQATSFPLPFPAESPQATSPPPLPTETAQATSPPLPMESTQDTPAPIQATVTAPPPLAEWSPADVTEPTSPCTDGDDFTITADSLEDFMTKTKQTLRYLGHMMQCLTTIPPPYIKEMASAVQKANVEQLTETSRQLVEFTAATNERLATFKDLPAAIKQMRDSLAVQKKLEDTFRVAISVTEANQKQQAVQFEQLVASAREENTKQLDAQTTKIEQLVTSSKAESAKQLDAQTTTIRALLAAPDPRLDGIKKDIETLSKAQTDSIASHNEVVQSVASSMEKIGAFTHKCFQATFLAVTRISTDVAAVKKQLRQEIGTDIAAMKKQLRQEVDDASSFREMMSAYMDTVPSSLDSTERKDPGQVSAKQNPLAAPPSIDMLPFSIDMLNGHPLDFTKGS